MTPIDRLDAMADRMSKGAADVKQIADTAKPLYASFDETQKHSSSSLGRMLMPERAPVRDRDDAPSRIEQGHGMPE